MKKIPLKRDSASPNPSKEAPPSGASQSRIEALFADQEFRLEWDNDLAYHVARNLQELRKRREMTQADVASAAGTTQPKVALAESADANLTVATIKRYVEALRGRVRFAIEPAELSIPRLPVWWTWPADAVPDGAYWSECKVHIDQTSPQSSTLIAGWKAPTPQTSIVFDFAVHSAGEFNTASVQMTKKAERLLIAPPLEDESAA
jgi:hypothetical protein